MTDVGEADTSDSAPVADSGDRIDCDGVRVRFYPRSSAMVLVAMSGQIDAANADCVGGCLRRALPIGRPVVVDITDVSFVAGAGVRRLCAFGEECAGAGTEWVLITSRVVRSLLGAVDAEHSLPTAESLGEALQRLADRRVRAPAQSPMQHIARQAGDVFEASASGVIR